MTTNSKEPAESGRDTHQESSRPPSLDAYRMCQPCARAGIAIFAVEVRNGEPVCGDCAAEIDAGREP